MTSEERKPAPAAIIGLIILFVLWVMGQAWTTEPALEEIPTTVYVPLEPVVTYDN